MAGAVSADTAVCVAGETRALIFPQVHARLRTTLVDALHADLYLVLSRGWSHGWHASVKAAAWRGVPNEVSAANVTSVVRRLRPIGAVVSDPGWEAGRAWWAAVEAWWPGCTTSQQAFQYKGCAAGSKHACTEAAFFASTCAGKLAEMLRWRACHRLLLEGEARGKALKHSLTLMRNCSAALLPPVSHRFLRAFGTALQQPFTVLPTYAMTESFPICSNPPADTIKLATVGPAMGPTVRVLHAHPRDEEVPPGEEGVSNE